MASNSFSVTTPTDREIVITRTFDAPRHLVWDAMTKPDLIRKWLFSPPGWSLTECTEDIRPGGSFHWLWSGPDGPAMSMRGVYREVVPPRPDGGGGRIVRTETFEFGCGPQAGEQLCTLELTQRDGKTHLTLTVLYPTKEARDATIASGMSRGVAAGYDNLDTILAATPY